MLSAPISAASSGANTIVSGIAGRAIRLLGYVLVASGTVSITWKGSTVGAVSGVMPLVAQSVLSVPPGGNAIDPIPLFVLPNGEDLVINLSGAVGVYGHIVYDLV